MAAFRAPEQSLDHCEVAERIFERHRNFRMVENRAGKRIALQRVLVADRERFGADAGATQVPRGVDKQPRRPVRRGIEGNLDFDAPGRSKDLDPLIRCHLRAAAKNRLAGWVVEDRRSEPVRVERRVTLDGGDHGLRLLAEQEP